MFSGSVDAGLVLALPFQHGDLEPDCVGVSTRGGLMCGIKIPPQDFVLKMQGGLICGTLRYVAAPDRNLILFCCVFQGHR